MAIGKRNNSMNNKGEALGIETILWASADKLRNNMDAFDYRTIQTLSGQLSWSHFVAIIHPKDPFQHHFYCSNFRGIIRECSSCYSTWSECKLSDCGQLFSGCAPSKANRRMNETREAMACSIFKSWFVDFNPVRVRADGREPAGMYAKTAALFPDGFEVGGVKGDRGVEV